MKRVPRSSVFWFALTGIVLLAVGLWLSWWQWDWLRSGSSASASNGDTLRNAGLILGGVLALVFALWRGWVAEQQKATAQRQAETAQQSLEQQKASAQRQAETAQQSLEQQKASAQRQADIAQQSLLNERYERGAEMLGSEVLAVRLGGIYALSHLAEEHPQQYHIRVMELFCAFARNPTGSKQGRRGPYTEMNPNPTAIREDIQAALTAIARRSERVLLARERQTTSVWTCAAPTSAAYPFPEPTSPAQTCKFQTCPTLAYPERTSPAPDC